MIGIVAVNFANAFIEIENLIQSKYVPPSILKQISISDDIFAGAFKDLLDAIIIKDEDFSEQITSEENNKRLALDSEKAIADFEEEEFEADDDDDVDDSDEDIDDNDL